MGLEGSGAGNIVIRAGVSTMADAVQLSECLRLTEGMNIRGVMIHYSLFNMNQGKFTHENPY